MIRRVVLLSIPILAFSGLSPIVLSAGVIDDATRVFDACKASTAHPEDWCRALVMSSNFETCYKRCNVDVKCFDGCAVRHPPGTPVPWSLRGDRPRLAAEFIGLTESDLVKRFGPPIETTRSDSPDGPFRMVVFSKEKGREIFFTILDKDGVVSNGSYGGTMFDDPGYHVFAAKCAKQYPTDLDAQMSCSSRYRTPPKKK